jgi:hypothetical protein
VDAGFRGDVTPPAIPDVAERLLTAVDVAPTPDVLQRELEDLFPLYERLTARLAAPEFDVRPEWRYYRDGGAWLCKMTRRTKTVFWLSAWRSCLRVAFYFTERSGAGIPGLPIDASLIAAYANASPIGKLTPLLIEVRSEEQLDDVVAVAAYKVSRT